MAGYMHRGARPGSLVGPSLSFILIMALLATLALAGGASRADAFGQVVVRSVAWISMLIILALGPRPSFASARQMAPVLFFTAAAGLLVMVQLVPLPPGTWQSLPGHEPFAEAALVAGRQQPWRPWSIVPDITVNSLSSLVVPAAILLFLAGLKETERLWLPGLLLALVTASMLVGLLEFSGASLDSPLVNDSAGQVSGSFANRNHFALFLALGCLIAPVWAYLDSRRPGWRGPVALGLVLLFALTILATGSRAGLVLGALAIGMGMMLARREIRRSLRRAPRWAFPALITVVVATLLTFVLLSVVADRAASIDRVLAVDAGQDMRSRSLPTVLAMIAAYFPFGSGFGGFDTVFRMHEPFGLLKHTYFNHAHNDFLEIALDGGLPGMLLLGAALVWWAVTSLRAWRAGSEAQHVLPKLGSAILLLILIASLVDYPARTPMMMAIIVIAAVWLAGAAPRAALPVKNQHL